MHSLFVTIDPDDKELTVRLLRTKENEQKYLPEEVQAEAAVEKILRPYAKDIKDLPANICISQPRTEFTLPRMSPQNREWEQFLLDFADMWPSHFVFIWQMKAGQNAELTEEDAMRFLCQLYVRFTGVYGTELYLPWQSCDSAPEGTYVRFDRNRRRLTLCCPKLTGMLIGKRWCNIKDIRERVAAPLGIEIRVQDE